jgi:hypothetical protein
VTDSSLQVCVWVGTIQKLAELELLRSMLAYCFARGCTEGVDSTRGRLTRSVAPDTATMQLQRRASAFAASRASWLSAVLSTPLTALPARGGVRVRCRGSRVDVGGKAPASAVGLGINNQDTLDMLGHRCNQ